MSKPRFYFPEPLLAHQRFEMPDALSHYALRVLRLKNEEEIIVFDGEGGEYPARLDVQGKRAFVQTEAHDAREVELSGRLTLIQGLPTGDKMDWIVEKAVELGAFRVIPIAAQRSVLQLRGERLEKRVAHWQRVARSASEQCGRNRIMAVDRPCTLQDYLQQSSPDEHQTTLLCHPDHETSLHEVIHDIRNRHLELADGAPRTLQLMIGPEGGWSDAELALARQHGIRSVCFGSRVLRTETAGLALIAAVTALLDWN